jgi:murein DD-endopeptidase MepM/ murein hydrolase activator NlpD
MASSLLRLALVAASLALYAQSADAQSPAVEVITVAEAVTTRAATEGKSEKPDSRWVLTQRPVPGKLSSHFGVRPDPVAAKRKHRKRKRKHKGVDFVATRGTRILAAGAGIVVKASRSGGYGRMVIIDHGDGLQTRYAHLQRIKVKRGDFLPAGAVLGTVGSSGRTTGPHLHFEVRQNGVALPPQDVIHFKLPECSKKARHCKRPRPRNT